MLLELTRLFLSILLREGGGYTRRKPRKPVLDPDAATVYKVDGADTYLIEVDGVGLLIAPEAVASRFRSRAPERKTVRVYSTTREFVSKGLSGVLKESEESGGRG